MRHSGCFLGLIASIFLIGCSPDRNAGVNQRGTKPSAVSPHADGALFTWLPSKIFYLKDEIPLLVIVANTGESRMAMMGHVPPGMGIKMVVRDASGRDVPMTKEGRQFFGVDWSAGSVSTRWIDPGHIDALTCRIDEYFAIKAVPGQFTHYTVTVERSVGFENGTYADPVAPPIPFELAGVGRYVPPNPPWLTPRTDLQSPDVR